MKAFLITLLIFASLLTGSVIHALSLTAAAQRLEELEARFPVKLAEKNSPDDTMRQAEEYWMKIRDRLTITVNQRQIIAVTSALGNVIDYYEQGSVADYEASRRLLREALLALAGADELSLHSII